MEQALSIAPSISDWLPPPPRECYSLLPEDTTVREIRALHDTEDFIAARKRIVFSGFFRSLYAVCRLKETLRKEESFYTFGARASLVEF